MCQRGFCVGAGDVPTRKVRDTVLGYLEHGCSLGSSSAREQYLSVGIEIISVVRLTSHPFAVSLKKLLLQ